MLLQLLHGKLYFVSNFGTNLPVFVGLIFFVSLFLVHKRLYKSSVLVLLTSLSYFYSIFLKGVFKVARPVGHPVLYSRFPADIYAFPSSHVTVYTAVFGFFFYLSYKKGLKKSIVGLLLRWISAYFLFLVGISRIFLGYHSLSDVFAGYFFGGLYLFGLVWLDRQKGFKVVSKSQQQND